MNRVEELIQQLCPNGVEWKKLGDYIELYTGEQLNKDAMLSDGVYPVMNGGVVASGFTDSFNEEADTITISQGGASAGFVNWIESKFWAGAHCFIVKVINDKIINRYLYFFLKNSERKMMLSKYGAGIPSLSKESVNKLLIPIPPLPIQQEIVRILDTFTELQKELTANLQTELDARKKQYAYYRDCLLNFEGVDGVEWKKLGEVLRSIRTGLNPRTFFKLNTPDAGSYYVTIREFSNGKLKFTSITDKINEKARVLCNNRSNLELDDVLFSGTGTIGETYVINQEPLNWNIKEGVYALKPIKTIILPQYLQYILSQSNIKSKYLKLADGGTVKSISMKKLNDFSIPIPPLPEQRRIVAILDHFETLVNDLSVGLPAELEARRKQYEYYRDKLLTFDRV